MTQIIAPPLTLYDRDLDLWLETAIAQLKAGDWYNLDVENLIEELEGLSGCNKREIEHRLERLIDGNLGVILTRCYMLIFGKSQNRQTAIASQTITSQGDRYLLNVKPR